MYTPKIRPRFKPNPISARRHQSQWLALVTTSLLVAGCSVSLRKPDHQVPDSSIVESSKQPALQNKGMQDQAGAAWSVQDIYATSPVVVVFYRGSW